MQTRRSFAHTERPQGAPGPMHRTQALDALSALAKRGGANINAQQLQKPMQPMPQQRPPSPVAMEAMSRSMPSYGAPMQGNMGMPMGQPVPYQQPQPQPIPEMAQEPVAMPGMEYQEPPYDGFYADLLADSVRKRPMPEGVADWRIEALDRFALIKAKLDAVKQYVFTGDMENIRTHVRETNRTMANV